MRNVELLVPASSLEVFCMPRVSVIHRINRAISIAIINASLLIIKNLLLSVIILYTIAKNKSIKTLNINTFYAICQSDKIMQIFVEIWVTKFYNTYDN